MTRNSLYMERLFTLLMTGAYGLVMVWMFASHYLGWNKGERSILSLVTTWIQYTILIGGVALLILFFVLLFNLKRSGDGHHHTHELDEDSGNCHDEGCNHEHHQKHEHHDHHGGHDCCDHGHEHNWNPIRYIPLLIPLILIVMGLPDTRMIENFEKYRIDQALQERGKQVVVNEQMCWMMLGSFSGLGEVFPQMGFSTTFASGVQSILDELDDEAKDVAPIVTDLAQLEKVAMNPAMRSQFEAHRKIELEGMFSLEEVGAYTFFRIVRMRMACCLTDSKPAMILCRMKKPLPANLIESNKSSGTKWVKVQGRVKFAQGPDGKYYAFLKAVKVESSPMPPFPYLS